MTEEWQRILLAASEFEAFAEAWNKLVMRVRRGEAVDPSEWRDKLATLDSAYTRFIGLVPMDMPNQSCFKKSLVEREAI